MVAVEDQLRSKEIQKIDEYVSDGKRSEFFLLQNRSGLAKPPLKRTKHFVFKGRK